MIGKFISICVPCYLTYLQPHLYLLCFYMYHVCRCHFSVLLSFIFDSRMCMELSLKEKQAWNLDGIHRIKIERNHVWKKVTCATAFKLLRTDHFQLAPPVPPCLSIACIRMSPPALTPATPPCAGWSQMLLRIPSTAVTPPFVLVRCSVDLHSLCAPRSHPVLV